MVSFMPKETAEHHASTLATAASLVLERGTEYSYNLLADALERYEADERAARDSATEAARRELIEKLVLGNNGNRRRGHRGEVTWK